MRQTSKFYVFVFSLLVLAACSGPQDIRESRFIMGTLVQFTISGAEEDVALEAIRAAATEMQRIEDVFTIYGTQSNAVKAFNASQPGAVVALPDEVDRLLKTSIEVALQSGGAFTPAIGSLSLLWGFSLPESPVTPPSELDVVNALVGVDTTLLVHEPKGWKRLNSQTQLDFGGIAKGYAIDRGITVLREHGIANAIVDAGGDLRAIGKHAGRPWRIGLRHPRKEGSTLGWFEVSGDISIVTSGDYERFFMYEGKRYQHILDPQSGMPAERSSSATVITVGDTTMADAWSTALFVSGAEALSEIEARGMQGLLVDADGQMHATKLTLLPFHPTVQ
jgi:FAD:protein FMN transferase